MPIKILAIGDMHLGRQPSKLPIDLASRAQALSPSAAWWRAIEQAEQAKVDLVLLAGDLVDQEDDLFEAYRPLEQGINRLVAAGIEVVGISGNHDVAVLPKLADQLSAFKLLGREGQWEVHSIVRGSEQLHLHGWSFPKAVVTDSPLAGHSFESLPGINLGLLHGDRDQLHSTYAPVSTQDLNAAGLDGWLLGHIHKPDALNKDHLQGYLGSLTGLHIGETGIRGPWLISIEHGRVQSVMQLSIAPLLWMSLPLDVSGAKSPSDALSQLLEQIRSLDAVTSQYDQPPEAIGLRVELLGETDLTEGILALFGDQRDRNWAVNHIDHIFIESIQDKTLPAIDLQTLAEQPNHIGQLAKALLMLQEPSHPDRPALIHKATAWLAPFMDDEKWQHLPKEPLTESMVVDYLDTAAHRLLRDLLAQTKAWQS